MPKDFPDPPSPYNFHDMVQNLLAMPGYAEFIHDLVERARSETKEDDANAAALRLLAHFRPRRSELGDLKIPTSERQDALKCTDNRTRFLDFAKYVHVSKRRAKCDPE